MIDGPQREGQLLKIRSNLQGMVKSTADPAHLKCSGKGSTLGTLLRDFHQTALSELRFRSKAFRVWLPERGDDLQWPRRSFLTITYAQFFRVPPARLMRLA